MSTLVAMDDFDGDSEKGMATAEYAIGTVAATSFAGILVWLFKQDWVRDALISIVKAIFNLVF